MDEYRIELLGRCGRQSIWLHLPSEYLIQAILAVALLYLTHRIDQLVLVKVDNLSAGNQIGTHANQFSQVKHGASDEHFVFVFRWYQLREIQSRSACPPVPFLGGKTKYLIVG